MCVILMTLVELAVDTSLIQQEAVFRGDPSISENWDPLFSDSFRIISAHDMFLIENQFISSIYAVEKCE